MDRPRMLVYTFIILYLNLHLLSHVKKTHVAFPSMTQDLHPFPHRIPPCKWPSARDVVRPKVPSCQGPTLTTVPFYRCSSMGPAGLSKSAAKSAAKSVATFFAHDNNG